MTLIKCKERKLIFPYKNSQHPSKTHNVSDLKRIPFVYGIYTVAVGGILLSVYHLETL
jgi:hypothetical protein